jgi:SAM-dependent methyltransferase
MLPNQCPNCCSKDLLPINNRVYGDESQTKRFFQCVDCEIIFQFPFFTKEEVMHFYHSQFEKFMATRSKNTSWNESHLNNLANKITSQRRLQFLKTNFNIDRKSLINRNVLEIGCSSGFMLLEFQKYGALTHGIEPSKLFSEFLVSNKIKVHDDIDSIKSEQFDYIFHFFVMEHIVDQTTWFSQQLRILKKGGKIIIEVPCSEDPLRTYYNNDAFLNFYWSIVHPYYFNIKSIKVLFDNINIKDYRIIPYQRYGLKNHLGWQTHKEIGHESEFDFISEQLDEKYKNIFVQNSRTDTLLIEITK